MLHRRTTIAALALVVAALAPGCSGGGRPAGSSASQQGLRADPAAARAKTEQAQVFLQKARETADPTFYVKAEGLLKEAGKLDGGATDMLTARGSLELS